MAEDAGRGWIKRGACYLNPDPDVWFDDEAERRAKQVCARCACRADCLTYALVNDCDEGVWGGLTADERRELRRVAAA